MKPSVKIIPHLISGLLVLGLSGCANLMSSKMPQGSVTMTEAYNNAINGNNSNGEDSLDQVRTKVQRLPNFSSNYTAYTRTAKNAIDNQFPLLPNSTIVMYVFPHEAGVGNNVTPVPGYSTVFPLYSHVQYAMPGEVDTVH